MYCRSLCCCFVLECSNFNSISYGYSPCDDFWSWDCWGNMTAIASADILGAAGGVVVVAEAEAYLNIATGGTAGTIVLVGAGVICGAGASYAAANCSLVAWPFDPTIIGMGDITVELSEEYKSFSTVGIQHNEMIHNYFF